MILSIEDARNALRVDGDFNDDIIIPLVEAIPNYLYITTGRDWLDEPVQPLAQTTAKFILQLWFDPQTQDSERLKRTIDSLLGALHALEVSTMAKAYHEHFINQQNGKSARIATWHHRIIYVNDVEM